MSRRDTDRLFHGKGVHRVCAGIMRAPDHGTQGQGKKCGFIVAICDTLIYMNDDSIFSLIMLLALFFVLPAVLRLLGQYTSKSRNAQKREEEGDIYQASGNEPPSYREELPSRTGYDDYDHSAAANKPIHPRWF